MPEVLPPEHRDRALPRVAAGTVRCFLAYMEALKTMLLHQVVANVLKRDRTAAVRQVFLITLSDHCPRSFSIHFHA